MSKTIGSGFTRDVHDTLLALTLHVYVLKIWLFFSFYNSTVLCIVEFSGHLLSDRDTSSTGMEAGEWEYLMGMRIKLNMGIGVNH